MTKKVKKPKAAVSLAVVRAPASPELVRVGQAKIVWRFAKLDLSGEWSWRAITQTELLDAIEKLRHYEELTWAEAATGGKLKPIPVSSLCKQAQGRLQSLKLNDVDDVWELRLSAQCRVWGLRLEPAFMLLWWDPNHSVCPSPKKHT